MNILQITTELRLAGAERVIISLCHGLLRRGHQVHLLALMPPPPSSPVLEELAELGIHPQSAHLHKAAPWRLLRLRTLARQFAPDLVHSHLFHGNLAARLTLPPAWPLLNTVHIAERRTDKNWHFTLDRWTLTRCHRQNAVSHAVADFHAPRLGLQPADMPVIYNGIEPPPQLTPDQIAKLRQRWGVADCQRLLGSVGRLDPQKGYDLLLDRLAHLSDLIPPGETWGLVIIGEGPQRPQLEQLATHLPPTLRLILPGFSATAAADMGAFDLFLMPSRYEGFGLTLVEAMGHGLPIIANAIDSLPELLADYPNGDAIPIDSCPPDTLRQAIAQALQRGKGQPDRRFTVDAMVDAYLDLYHQLLDQQGT